MSGIPIQVGRIKKNKRGSDRYVDGDTLCEPPVGKSIRTARGVRTEMSKKEVTAANVRSASNQTLLRIRARNIRSVYELLRRSQIHYDKVHSLYESKEGDGDNDSIIKEQRGYVALHGRVFDDLRALVERSPRSKSAWKKCNKGCGSGRRMFLEPDAAIEQKLSRRADEEAKGAHGPEASTRLERSTPVLLYPKQYATDFAHLQRELDVKYHVFLEPSRTKNWSRHVPTSLNLGTW